MPANGAQSFLRPTNTRRGSGTSSGITACETAPSSWACLMTSSAVVRTICDAAGLGAEAFRLAATYREHPGVRAREALLASRLPGGRELCVVTVGGSGWHASHPAHLRALPCARETAELRMIMVAGPSTIPISSMRPTASSGAFVPTRPHLPTATRVLRAG